MPDVWAIVCESGQKKPKLPVRIAPTAKVQAHGVRAHAAERQYWVMSVWSHSSVNEERLLPFTAFEEVTAACSATAIRPAPQLRGGIQRDGSRGGRGRRVHAATSSGSSP